MSKHYIASWRRQSWPSLPKVVLPLASLLNLCRSWLHCHQPICAKCYLCIVLLYALQRNYYISIIAQAEGGDFHGSGHWFQGMQDLCKKYGMNVSKQHMIAKLHFYDCSFLPYLIFVIFFTWAKFLENKIYTETRQFFALNL